MAAAKGSPMFSIDFAAARRMLRSPLVTCDSVAWSAARTLASSPPSGEATASGLWLSARAGGSNATHVANTKTAAPLTRFLTRPLTPLPMTPLTY